MDALRLVGGLVELGLLVALLVVARELRLLRRELPKTRAAILQPRLLDFPAPVSRRPPPSSH